MHQEKEHYPSFNECEELRMIYNIPIGDDNKTKYLWHGIRDRQKVTIIEQPKFEQESCSSQQYSSLFDGSVLLNHDIIDINESPEYRTYFIKGSLISLEFIYLENCKLSQHQRNIVKTKLEIVIEEQLIKVINCWDLCLHEFYIPCDDYSIINNFDPYRLYPALSQAPRVLLSGKCKLADPHQALSGLPIVDQFSSTSNLTLSTCDNDPQNAEYQQSILTNLEQFSPQQLNPTDSLPTTEENIACFEGQLYQTEERKEEPAEVEYNQRTSQRENDPVLPRKR